MVHVEELLGDSAGKNSEWERAGMEVANIQEEVEARGEQQHATVQGRSEYLERRLVDSTNKHRKSAGKHRE